MTSFSFEPFYAKAAEPMVRAAFALGLLVWGLLLAKGRRGFVGLVFGCLLVTATSGFWMRALPRPYGMLTEPNITERLATASVIATTGNEAESCFARESNPHRLRDSILVFLKLEPAFVIAAFSWVPILLPALLVTALTLLAARKEASLVAAASVLLFWPAGSHLLTLPTLLPPSSFWGDPWGAMGFLFLAVATTAAAERASLPRALLTILASSLSLLADPSLGLVFLCLAAAGLFLPGWPRRRDGVPFAASLLLPVMALLLLCLAGILAWPKPDGRDLPPLELLVWATLAQPAWLALAAVGTRRSPPRTGLVMWAGGGILFALRLVGVESVPLAPTLAVYRLGLILSASPAITELAGGLARLVSSGSWDRWRVPGSALLILVLGLSSPVYQATPARADHYYRLSLLPLPESYFAPAAWIQENTRPDAVVVADSQTAPFLAITAGRRFLRADGLAPRVDEARRRRVETRILGGRRADRIRQAADRYGVTHLAINVAGETEWLGVNPEDFEGREPFKKVHQAREWFYLFELTEASSKSGPVESERRSR